MSTNALVCYRSQGLGFSVQWRGYAPAPQRLCRSLPRQPAPPPHPLLRVRCVHSIPRRHPAAGLQSSHLRSGCGKPTFDTQLSKFRKNGNCASRVCDPDCLPPTCSNGMGLVFIFFFVTLVTGPRKSLSLKLSRGLVCGNLAHAGQLRMN